MRVCTKGWGWRELILQKPCSENDDRLSIAKQISPVWRKLIKRKVSEFLGFKT